jgi:hypothetical protein
VKRTTLSGEKVGCGEEAPLIDAKGREGEMKRLLGLGLVLALTTLGVAALPSAAYANSTCYTGCTTVVTGNPTPPTTVVTPPVEPKVAAQSGGLALTGADIGAMATVGAAALVVGGLMVRRSRRRHRAAV